jgi:hypothetical protein
MIFKRWGSLPFFLPLISCMHVQSISKKSAAYESNFLKIKRLEEDKRILKRQLARLKEMEKFENIDQLLQEENKQLRASYKISLPVT